MTPTLSIVIPSYNYAPYLPEALDSILAQDYDDYEVILIDDASSDNSAQIAQHYDAHHTSIRYIQNPKNIGCFETVLKGIKMARGSYIHCFSADDRYLPNYLSASMNFFTHHPKAKVVCTDLCYFKGEEKRIIHLLKEQKEPIFFSKDVITETLRTTSFWVPGTTCIFKRELWKQYGPYLPQLENLSDWFLFHHIALEEGMGYIPKVLTSMREHGNSLTRQIKQNKTKRRKTYHYLLNHLLKDKALCNKFLQAGLVNFILREFKWKLYLNPYYAYYWRRKKNLNNPKSRLNS